jgi:hypothetical protein
MSTPTPTTYTGTLIDDLMQTADRALAVKPTPIPPPLVLGEWLMAIGQWEPRECNHPECPVVGLHNTDECIYLIEEENV